MTYKKGGSLAANVHMSGIAGDYPARNDLNAIWGEIENVLTLIQDRFHDSIIGREKNDNDPQGLWERCSALSDAIMCQIDALQHVEVQHGMKESLSHRIQGLQQKASRYRICGLNIDRSTPLDPFLGLHNFHLILEPLKKS